MSKNRIKHNAKDIVHMGFVCAGVLFFAGLATVNILISLGLRAVKGSGDDK